VKELFKTIFICATLAVFSVAVLVTSVFYTIPFVSHIHELALNYWGIK